MRLSDAELSLPFGGREKKKTCIPLVCCPLKCSWTQFADILFSIFYAARLLTSSWHLLILPLSWFPQGVGEGLSEHLQLLNQRTSTQQRPSPLPRTAPPPGNPATQGNLLLFTYLLEPHSLEQLIHSTKGGRGQPQSTPPNTLGPRACLSLPCWFWHSQLQLWPTEAPYSCCSGAVREFSRSQTEQKIGPGGKQVSFHWSDLTYLLFRSTTCVSFRLSWLQAQLGQRGPRMKDPPYILSSPGPGLRQGLESGIPLYQQLLRRQLTSHQTNPKYRISVKLLCNLQPVAVPLWVIHITSPNSNLPIGHSTSRSDSRLLQQQRPPTSQKKKKKDRLRERFSFLFSFKCIWIIFSLLRD